MVRNLEIIGEAVKNIPIEILHAFPKIEWKRIARFRDIVIHRYFKVDLEVVWDILEHQLENLESAVDQILANIKQAS